MIGLQGVPMKFLDTPGKVRRASPALAPHTAEVPAGPPKGQEAPVSRVMPNCGAALGYLRNAVSGC